MIGVLGLALVLTVIPLFLILGYLLYQGVGGLNVDFFTRLPLGQVDAWTFGHGGGTRDPYDTLELYHSRNVKKTGEASPQFYRWVNKDYDAAAIANEVMIRMFERKVVDPAKIRTIYKSDTFPTTSYGMAHNLDPQLQEKIKEAFFTYPWEGSALKAEFKTEDRFVPITYKKDWSVIRKIDEASGVKYSCK